MNGKIKFHKPTGPAFLPGEKWVGSGGGTVTIVSVRKHSPDLDDDMSNFSVTYEWIELGRKIQHEKNVWNFQIRYAHVADLQQS